MHPCIELATYSAAHVAFTGNPAHLNFGKGMGKVGFFSGESIGIYGNTSIFSETHLYVLKCISN